MRSNATLLFTQCLESVHQNCALVSSSPLSCQLPSTISQRRRTALCTMQRRVVLITHGSMNPVHQGHVAMMVRAKELLEASGYEVVGGEIAITKQQHIVNKGAPAMHDSVRLQLIEVACRSQSSGLRGADGTDHGSVAKFIQRCAERLKRDYGGAAAVSVEGSDVSFTPAHTSSHAASGGHTHSWAQSPIPTPLLVRRSSSATRRVSRVLSSGWSSCAKARRRRRRRRCRRPQRPSAYAPA